MLAFTFIVGTIFVFAVLLAYENLADPSQIRPRQFGLLTWLISGNWPAKVGAGLLILGVGALIRYFLLNVDWSADIKLGSGVFSATLLAAASYYLRERPGLKGLHRALAGAALGVMYLTAYSAYGFFGYFNEIEALAFLVLVAVAGGVYSVRGNAESIAVLSMMGAFAAPAFTIGTPGPAMVYGYYVGASAFAFLLVYLRGWRALIHLSFLFTLAGALFFGWTREYYRPEHFAVLQPLLLALVAIHLAMPLAERRALPGHWLRRFDTGYFIALPIVAGILNLLIAPTLKIEGALSFIALGGLWAIAAGLAARLHLDGALRHGVVAFLFILGATLMYLDTLPWTLLGLVVSTVLFALAARLKFSRESEQMLSGTVLVFWLLHALDFISRPLGGTPLLEVAPVPILTGIGALLLAAVAARGRDLILGKIIGVLALGWTGLLVMQEIIYLHLENLPQLVHFGVIALASGITLFVPGKLGMPLWPRTLVILLVASAWWAALNASQEMTWALTLLSPLAMFLLAHRMSRIDAEDKVAVQLIAATIPITVLPWAIRLDQVSFGKTIFIALILFVLSVTALTLLAGARKWEGAVWWKIQRAYFWMLLIVVAGTLLFHIERGLWPILFELVTLTTLALIAFRVSDLTEHRLAGMMTIAVAVLMLQAMMLRAFGPNGVLTASDLARMGMPGAVSLLWAAYGGTICWWSARASSRALWGIGAIFLVVAAVKLVLFDFGSLGQLGNIVAMILAGIVFLGVAWIAPIPPKPEITAPENPAPENAAPENIETGHSKKNEKFGDVDGWTFQTAPPVAEAIPVDALDKETPPSVSSTSEKAQPRHEAEIPIAWLTPEPEQANSSWTKGIQWMLLVVLGFSVIAALNSWDNASGNPHPAQTPAPSPSAAAMPQPVRDMETLAVSQPPQAAPIVVDSCSRFVDSLPSDFVLLAGGGYHGRDLDFVIDQSGHSASTMDVIVHHPNRPVVLALGAYEPTIWNIRRTPSTRIAAVWISGYHQQEVVGLTSQTPVLNSSYEKPLSCGYFYLVGNNASGVDAKLRKVFGRSADTYYFAENGKLPMGDIQLPENTIQDEPANLARFRVPSTPQAKQAGIDQLISEGKLRQARPEDMRAWEESVRSALGPSAMNVEHIEIKNSYGVSRTYIVQGSMSYPAGLYGAHSVGFIIPYGVPRPTGNPGHSFVYDFANPSCVGPRCR
jgi:hypothetical protein